MKAANIDICKELFELSGWGDSGYWYSRGYPAYDCDYLLRKLSSFDYKVKGKQGDIMPVRCHTFIWQETEHQWRAGYKYNLGGQRYDDLFIYADTPEEALCKLAIELFKQGALKSPYSIFKEKKLNIKKKTNLRHIITKGLNHANN